MKAKPYYLFFLLAMAFGAHAQGVLPVINEDSARYLFIESEFQDTAYYVDHTGMGTSFISEGHQYYADGETTLYGFAFRASRAFTSLDQPHPCYVRIYQQGSSPLQQQLLDSLPVTEQVVVDCAWHPIRLRVKDLDGNEHYFPLLELYFKRPVVVHDTFVIFVTPHPYPDGSSSTINYGYLWRPGDEIVVPLPAGKVDFISMGYFGTEYNTNDVSNWEFRRGNGFMNSIYSLTGFPILLPPPSSLPEEELQAPPAPEVTRLDSEGRSATVRTRLTNDPVYHQQLALGCWPASPDTLPLLTASRTTDGTTLENLELYTTYAVWVRNQVGNRYSYPQDTSFWTPWSAPAIFRLGHRDTVWNHGTIWVNDTLSVTGGEFIRIDSNTVWLNDSTIWIDGDTIVIGSDAVWLGSNLVIVGGERIITSSGNQGIISPSQGFTLRPNPASKEVTIEGYEGEVQIVDLQGRVVCSFTNHSPLTTHHLPALPPGTYLVKCGITVRKLVVQ